MSGREYKGNRIDWLDEDQWRDAVDMWKMGRDTAEIAHAMNVHESVIYNGLPWRRKEFGISEAAA